MNNVTLKDYEDVIKAGELYLKGCNGTSEIMKPAFDKNATINGEPIQTLFDGVDEAGPADCKGRVDVLDIVNDIAVIRVVMENYFGNDYVDFHVLKKEKDGWKILAKAFTEIGE